MHIQVCAPPINGKESPVAALTFPVIISKKAAIGRIPCKTLPSNRYSRLPCFEMHFGFYANNHLHEVRHEWRL